MLLLFINGEKGLCARSNEGKMYFPARNSSIKKAGLYDCIEVLDKDKYGFVSGVKIQCDFPNEEFLQNTLLKNIYNADRLLYRYDKFYVKEIGHDPIIFLHDTYDRWNVCYYREGSDPELFMFFNENRKYRRHFYDPVNFDDHDSFVDFKQDFNKRICEKLDMDKIFNYVTAVLCSTFTGMYSIEKIESITIFDEKIIKIVVDTHGVKNNKIYAYSSHFGFVWMEEVRGIDSTNYIKIDINELRHFMITNRYGYGCRDNKIDTKRVEIMNKPYVFKFHNGMYALSEITEEEKKIVDESFEELARIRKYMGKNFSKSIMTEIQKVSDQNILDIKF